MSTKSKQPKLFIELIPTTCHYSNVRTTVTKKEWDKIRFMSYESAQHKCEICGDVGKNQGYKHNVECHEIWDYNDETHVQKLVGLISLCPICHQVKHIGRAIAMKNHQDAYNQLAKVNKWTHKEVEEHILASFEVHRERSKYEWTLDLSILTKEPYNLKIDTDSKRIFEVKKYKKKKKHNKTKTATKKVAVKKGPKRPPKKK
jgi:5-methylcytosine-specific restriction endonuclease McrA